MSITRLPARVYSRNLMAAWMRFSCPQMPTRKNMGMIWISQKR